MYAGIFAEHGHELTVDEWQAAIGTQGGYDPAARLSSLTGRSFTTEQLYEVARPRFIEHFDPTPLPGVVDRIGEALDLGLRLAVATSSPGERTSEHLASAGLGEAFEHVVGRFDVPAVKPAPFLYEEACRRLDVDPSEALAIEDSMHGVTSAKDAGLWCIAVPHDLTRSMDLSRADLIVDSLAEVTLAELVERVAG